MTTLRISKRGIMELVKHEGIVLEAYKDSVNVWTWGIGITNASGHQVHPRYLDNPQTLTRVFEIYLWALQNYEADVDAAFSGYALNENERAAAVSFHYNTGAIGRATWVKDVLRGDMGAARVNFMNWSSPPEIIPRREAERDLFFDGKWTGSTTGTVWGVKKPSYRIDWGDATTVDISGPIDEALGGGEEPEVPPDPVPEDGTPTREDIQSRPEVRAAYDNLVDAVMKATVKG